MRLKDRYNPTTNMSISEGVRYYCNTQDSMLTDGELERLKLQTNNVTDVVGRLVEILHNIGVLTDAEVLVILDEELSKIK